MASAAQNIGVDTHRQSSLSNRAVLSRHLLQVVDRVPETRGLGVVLIDFGRMQRLRAPSPGTATVVFERRMKPVVVPPMLAKPGTAAPRQAQAPQRQRTTETSPATEWINLGLNCGGAALAWIGVAGLTSLAPATGGLSGWGAAILYGGAAASTGQCVVSVARVANVQRGRTDVNQNWDANRWYVRTMLAADVVGLVGAGGALKELKATNAVLREGGFSFIRSTRGETISRPMRRALTTALELQGGRRVPGVVINHVVRQRLMDGVGGVIGLFASSYSGALGETGSGFWDVVVWITEEMEQRS
ncbi:hypothetical protein C8J44_1559 [Sphingomonas sp. PP-CE-3A-406]|uniref:hypothetical protein n=1 Tax=Sphingomonas sp. PP-CE-3A-406 TaxID=2135659 RepID=UPI000EFA1A58|nr:hypothetical protein [Sphingomonas sp. PP-CE-3A-406]RMB53947.1 hypothetical protein C8J44_1559 [Sphingomonas sp. PP-CE-3A-406]